MFLNTYLNYFIYFVVDQDVAPTEEKLRPNRTKETFINIYNEKSKKMDTITGFFKTSFLSKS